MSSSNSRSGQAAGAGFNTAAAANDDSHGAIEATRDARGSGQARGATGGQGNEGINQLRKNQVASSLGQIDELAHEEALEKYRKNITQVGKMTTILGAAAVALNEDLKVQWHKDTIHDGFDIG